LPAVESGNADQLARIKCPQHKIVVESAGSQAMLDGLECHGLVLGRRLGKGPGLELQSFKAKLPEGLSVSFGKAAEVHDCLVTVYR
jgi:hypothetical protein